MNAEITRGPGARRKSGVERRWDVVQGATVLALIAVLGLAYVKWLPYWHKALTAMSSHSIGGSILTGGAAQPPTPSWDAAWAYAWAYGRSIWQAMVLGLLLGSGVQALLPSRWILRWLGRANTGRIAAGTALALPGMMCTCCAAPVVVGLRRAHASAGAAVAFWLGNSVLNPATLVFMGFVLGWRWSALRLVLGLLGVIGLGLLADRMALSVRAADAEGQLAAVTARETGRGLLARWLTILVRMAVRLLPEYLVLVLLLGAARAWLFPYAGPWIGDGLGWILAFAVAGAVFVIPTAGEVPIVQAMLAAGVGVGPAGALVMVLPPISLPSLAMVAGVFSPRLLAVLSVGVVALGVIGGLAAIALRF